jgi:hypothetical protein
MRRGFNVKTTVRPWVFSKLSDHTGTLWFPWTSPRLGVAPTAGQEAQESLGTNRGRHR